MLKEIVLDMELRLNNSNSNAMRKMHLYSGHDISLVMMMNYLGNIIDMPDFGASIHLHLYLDKTNGYIIKVRISKSFKMNFRLGLMKHNILIIELSSPKIFIICYYYSLSISSLKPLSPKYIFYKP